jgi:hypothetical protein
MSPDHGLPDPDRIVIVGSRPDADRVRRIQIVTRIRQAALFAENGETFNALLVLDEAREMLEKEVNGGGSHGSDEEDPAGEHPVE